MSENNFENLYEVVKTITFELKTVQESQDINFLKSQNWIQKEYFTENKIIKDQNSEQFLLEFRDKVVDFTEDFIVNLEKGNILLRVLEIQKQLVEKCDRQLFYKLKKVTKIQVKNSNAENSYLVSTRFSDSNSLDVICNMAKDEKCYFVSRKLSQLLDKIKFYGEKIKQDLIHKNNQNTIHLYSGNVQFYSNWRGFISNLKDLVEILGFISKNQKAENLQSETKWNKTEKVLKELEFIKSEFEKLKNQLKVLEDKINEEAKKPIIFTSLNGRAVNKDQSKVESEYQKVLELEQSLIILTTELSAINEQKFDIVEKLDQALKDNIESLKILDDKYVLDLFQRSSKGEKFDRESEETIKIKEFKLAKRILKYIKFSGVIVTNRKNNKNEYLDILNYGKPNEKVAFNLLKIQTHPNYEKFKIEYINYCSFCNEKFKKSQELGNAKSLYNAINREVLRQKAMNYLSLLICDSEFYYLALLQKDFAKDNQIIEKLKQNPTENWQMLDYHKITFKALEKLALLDKSTFDIENETINFEIKKIYQSKLYKPKNDSGFLTFENKQNLYKLINYCKKCLAKIPEANLYDFKFQETQKYNTLEEFADEIDKQGYKSSWSGLNKDYLFELEKQDNENVLVFKLHNQDFRRDKIQDKTRKVNLFTKYWFDAMKLGQEIRITPEIDIFKRNKEEIIEQRTRKLKTTNKEIIEKARNYQDKIYGVFRLQFYPRNNLLIDQEKQLEQINQEIKNKNSKENKTYYLGLDRGENELVSFCLVDSAGQMIKNGDWTKLGGFDYTTSLKKYQTKKQQLFEKYADVSACNDDKVKIELEKQAKKLQQEFDIEGLLAAEAIKKGYCSYLINEINQILVEYPNTYIVLEDLDIKGKVNSETGENNKEQNLEKTMGATVYQAIENAIVNKFKYYVVKTGEYNGKQFVPNITKIEDLRINDEATNEDNRGIIRFLKSKDQIGSILFVDEKDTSATCPSPDCNYCINKEFRDWIRQVNIYLDTDYALINGKKYEIPSKNLLEDVKLVWLNNNIHKQITSNTQKSHFLDILEFRAKDNKKTFKEECRKEDFVHCPKCSFSSENCNSEKLKNDEFVIKTGDDVAAYNIAKRGMEFISGNKQVLTSDLTKTTQVEKNISNRPKQHYTHTR